ncbi:PAC2 family protein [Kytococcus sedentarius]|uniref:PAC2 family protein n=1 Tax=Kytococcus sedentarius TaxID=1276 RepID=UPI00384B7270
MQDPSELFRIEDPADIDPRSVRTDTLWLATGGLVDAGDVEKNAVAHVLSTMESRVVASFDVDALLDYRARRPLLTFQRDRYISVDMPSLVVHRVTDPTGRHFLLLNGPEPDYQWERFLMAVLMLAQEFGVRTLVSANGAPMQVPHTRPTGLTAYASDERLIADHASVFGTMQVPGHVDGLAHVRFAEAGIDTIGFAIHVPGYLADREMLDGTVAALHAISEATGIEVPMDDLEKRAEVNRRELDELVKSNPEALEVVRTMEQQFDEFMSSQQRRSLTAHDVAKLPSPDEIASDLEEWLASGATMEDAPNEPGDGEPDDESGADGSDDRPAGPDDDGPPAGRGGSTVWG